MKKLLVILVVLTLFLSCEEEVPSESEPNDTFGTADVISMNETLKAEISSGDVDHFQFTVPAGEKYRVTLEWLSGDLDLYVGVVLYTNGAWEIQGYTDNTDEAGDETFTITNSSSADLEWIVGALDYWDTGTGSYTITLTDDGSASGASGASVSTTVVPELPANSITAPSGNKK